uniref:Uncharacterized protein n=1 Tax=Laticauda laticaudata TaxID=8630 RepID=A0A8C5RYE7_LATLA
MLFSIQHIKSMNLLFLIDHVYLLWLIFACITFSDVFCGTSKSKTYFFHIPLSPLSERLRKQKVICSTSILDTNSLNQCRPTYNLNFLPINFPMLVFSAFLAIFIQGNYRLQGEDDFRDGMLGTATVLL